MGTGGGRPDRGSLTAVSDDFWDDLDDLEDEELLDAWAEENREALELLSSLLPEVLDADPPQPELDEAVAALVAGVTDAGPEYGYFDAACGWGGEVGDRTGDPRLWVDALASTVEPTEDPGIDTEAESAVAALDHADWLAVVVGLARSRPGADANPARLVELIRSSQVVETGLVPDDEPLVEYAFEVLMPRWQALGVVDRDRRLTRLGGWGLPQALRQVWGGTDAGSIPMGAFVSQGAAGALLHWQQEPEEWTPELYAEAAALLGLVTPAPLAVDLIDNDGWQPFLERVYAETSGSPASAAPAYLLSVRAEWAGETGAQSRWLEAALAADPAHVESLEVAAAEAGDRGDAVLALDLLRRAGVESTDPELATYTSFAKPATGGTARNAPCPCGSGRKFKLCCGPRIGHPLSTRSNWLWEKVARFAQRPPQRPGLLTWAALADQDLPAGPQVLAAAMVDPMVRDAALWDGGLLERFLTVRGPLLPADELALAQEWRESRRSAYEVVSARPGVGVTLRDLSGGAVLDVRERTASRELRPGDLLLARLLGTGDGAMFGFVMTVPRMSRVRLLDVLSAGEAEDIFAWFTEARRPPRLTNTEGEELVAIEQRWRLSARGWDRLASALESDGPDVLLAMYDDERGDRWVRGRLERRGDEVVLSTNSAERLARLVARLRAADPKARLLSEGQPDAGGLRSVPEPVEMTPEILAALQNTIRRHEERWVEEEIPMFGNRTPRQMVKTAAGRREVEDFLADVESSPPLAVGVPTATMDPIRIRELLGLPTHERGSLPLR